jgi:CBS domain-containing protein
VGRIRLGSKAPLTVAPGDTVAEAALAISERGVGAATVVEGATVAGVVTERDILKKIVVAGRDPRTTKVRDIMTTPVLSVGLKTSVSAAAELMRKHHIRHLVVLDEQGMLVGMLALRYLLYDLMDDLERKVGDLELYLMTDGPGG